jgi:hypothetical protein
MTQPISSKLSTLQSTRKFSTKNLIMLQTKIESVNNLVDEEPKYDYENINVTWIEKVVMIRPFEWKKKIRATIEIPIGYNNDILKRMINRAWKATKLRTDLTQIEKAYYWQAYLQEYISINREFMS